MGQGWLVRGGGARRGAKGACCTPSLCTAALSPGDSVTPQLIHMQEAHMKAPNEEGINYSLIRLLCL